ncbi:hypothetical protein FVER14953_20493 [Fusarium verticillioides]|nr:hypothetical protein FVER14953_20493 [Fusarium verticillioides]
MSIAIWPPVSPAELRLKASETQVLRPPAAKRNERK